MKPTALQNLEYIHFLFVHSYYAMLDYLLQRLLKSAVCSFIFCPFNDTGNMSKNVALSDRTVNENWIKQVRKEMAMT